MGEMWHITRLLSIKSSIRLKTFIVQDCVGLLVSHATCYKNKPNYSINGHYQILFSSTYRVTLAYQKLVSRANEIAAQSMEG